MRYLPLFILLLLAAGCRVDQRGAASSDAELNVVATTSIIADLAREIGGDSVRVVGLMGPGIDPHLYQASAGDVTRMSQADLVLYNGLHLEGKMTDVFEQMRGRGVPVVAVAEESIPDQELLESPTYQGNYDPHVWLDVALWSRVAETVAETLAEHFPQHAETFRRRLQSHQSELTELDEYVRERLAELPEERRVLITSHDAFGYFGRAYDVDVRGLQGISTATEAGTADVQRLAEFVASRRIPALFVESSISPKGIEAVREAVRDRGFDVKIGGTLYGDALGDSDSEAGHYPGMIRHNVDTIVASLNP